MRKRQWRYILDLEKEGKGLLLFVIIHYRIFGHCECASKTIKVLILKHVNFFGAPSQLLC